MAIVCLALFVYFWVLIAAIVMSWLRVDPHGPAGQVQRTLWRVTDPVLAPVRSVLPSARIGGVALDLSPVIVLFGIQLLSAFLCS